MYVEARKRLVDWLRRQLIGPAGEHRVSPEINRDRFFEVLSLIYRDSG